MLCKNCGSRYIQLKPSRFDSSRAIALCKVCLFGWVVNMDYEPNDEEYQEAWKDYFAEKEPLT